MTSLEQYFQQFRSKVIGIDGSFVSNTGSHNIIYADWTASGRMYRPIEDIMVEGVSPLCSQHPYRNNIYGHCHDPCL